MTTTHSPALTAEQLDGWACRRCGTSLNIAGSTAAPDGYGPGGHRQLFRCSGGWGCSAPATLEADHTLTPQALAAATVALCKPGTFDRRSTDERTGTVSLTLRSGHVIDIRRDSWAAGGGLYWQGDGVGGSLPDTRFEAAQTMVSICESRARAR